MQICGRVSTPFKYPISPLIWGNDKFLKIKFKFPIRKEVKEFYNPNIPTVHVRNRLFLIISAQNVRNRPKL